ncbi:MAG: phosphoenolpyruvate carboxykinase domain-containing protein, partial [Phycisphaeraceae bacterium]
PAHLTDWRGNDWTPEAETKAAHPNSRFTTPASQCPVIAPEWEDPAGVPIDAILFGGRRATTIPLVAEAFNWQHGVFLGSIMGSERTAAAAGKVGEVRFDPMAMLPFCGYHMGDYFKHWLDMGEQGGATADTFGKLPRIYFVNWFRKDEQDHHYLWPGFGDNARVLKWIFERCEGKVGAHDTLMGRLPTQDELDLSGLKVPDQDLHQLFEVEPARWREQLAKIEDHFAQFGDKLPAGLREEFKSLKQRLAT